MIKWTDNEVLIAIDLLKNNKTYLEIGKILNRSGKSVKEKLRKIGYRQTDFTIKEVKNCLNCLKEIEKSTNKFCSQSCSATFNNKLRPKKKSNNPVNEKINKRKRDEYHKRKKNFCLNCNKETTNKFCSSECQSKVNEKYIFLKIENGDKTLPSKQYKKFLIFKYGNKCMECGWCEKNPLTNNVPIQLEHIDGNSDNNSLDNLKLLCPNCHSLTTTFGSLNRGNGRHKRRERYKDGKSY